MMEFNELKHFGGFDWARDHHCVVVVHQQGEIVLEFDDSAEGWKEFVGQADGGDRIRAAHPLLDAAYANPHRNRQNMARK